MGHSSSDIGSAEMQTRSWPSRTRSRQRLSRRFWTGVSFQLSKGRFLTAGAGERIDQLGDDLLFANPNHQSGAWKPSRSRRKERASDEDDSEEEEEGGTDESTGSEKDGYRDQDEADGQASSNTKVDALGNTVEEESTETVSSRVQALSV